MLVLKKRADFLRVASSRKKVVTHHCVVQVACGPELHDITPRFGFTATKKLGNAVIRNRTKRRMRAAVTDLLQDDIIPPYDFVLIGRHDTASCEYTELLRDLCYAFKKAPKLMEKSVA